jgi:hypothetical protein
MIDDEFNVRIGGKDTIDQEANNGASRIEVELDHLPAHSWDEIVVAAIGKRRMDEHDCLPPVEFFPDGFKNRIPGYLSRMPLKIPMPSACNVSKEYSISRNVPSISGIGSAANIPKRPG